MKILLDTNIIIHREASTIVNEDIGVLFRWLDQLKYEKCIHPLTIEEITKNKDDKAVKTFLVKLDSYYKLKTSAPMHDNVVELSKKIDINSNDINDSILINEVYCSRVDYLITEDKKIHTKAEKLNITDKVLFIDTFIEKVTIENPSLVDYKVLSVKKELFGNIDLKSPFFDSFKEDYVGFQEWFNKKSDETAYICKQNEEIMAFLYLKVEGKDENYSDIKPGFEPKRRLKIGTFKVTLNGFKLGERFIKIIFDNAIKFKVEEVYVTIFQKTVEQQRLIRLMKEFGFEVHGTKSSSSGEEIVLKRNLQPNFSCENPKSTYPYISLKRNIFLVPIYPEYHTQLLPDSILTTESPKDFEENEPYRNAISKVYISRSYERNLMPGDVLIFYRTGGYHASVITTLGIVEKTILNIKSDAEFIKLCRNRSVFSDNELLEHWNYNQNYRPFITNFLYTYSFPQRINLKRLIEIGVIADIKSAPRGFARISENEFKAIIKETKTDESIIIY